MGNNVELFKSLPNRVLNENNINQRNSNNSGGQINEGSEDDIMIWYLDLKYYDLNLYRQTINM